MKRDIIFKHDDLAVWKSPSDELVFHADDCENGTATSTYLSRDEVKQLWSALSVFLGEAAK